MTRRLVWTAFAVAVAVSGPASAQTGSRFQLGVGVVWTAPYDAGAQRAVETPNPTAGAQPLTLFTADGRVHEGAGAVLRFTARLARRVSAEAEGRFSRPMLSVTLSGDFEGIPSTTADEQLTQYGVGGSVLVDVAGGTHRLRPFVAAGAGYVRQVQDHNINVDGGAEWHAGGGVLYRLTSRLSLRADARVLSTSKTPAFDAKRRYLPQVIGSIVVGL